MSEIKRTIKDSVFTYLFSQPEYARELYLNLHPEDQGVTEADVRLVTLENILTTGQYNDLGLRVRDKLILLVEAQSTYSPKIALRMLMYLAETYKDYVEEKKISLYSDKKDDIPRPELYVVYTGKRKNVPDVLKLSDLYDGTGSVEVEVKVLRGENPKQILGQYFEFCKISDEQVALHGRTDAAATETIRICLERGVLVPFLNARQKEVHDIMRTLFSQEAVWEIERYNVRQEGRQGEFERIVRSMRKKGLDSAEIASLLERDIADVEAVK
jgi:hypothetical protein